MSCNQTIRTACRTAMAVLGGIILAGMPALGAESAAAAGPAKTSGKITWRGPKKTPTSQTPEPKAEPKQKQKGEGESVWHRLSYGGRFSYVPKNLMRNRSDYTYVYSDPAVSTTYTTTAKSGHVGVGPTIEYTHNSRIFVSADLLYRRFGYQLTTKQVVGPDLTASEQEITTTTELTHANFWDIPLLVHVSQLPLPRVPSRMFFSAGGAARFVSSVRTSIGTTDPNADTCCSEAPKATKHSSIFGGVVGAGIRFRDDFGVKMTVEGRYTRWTSQVFTMPGPVSPNQVDIVLGFTF